METARIKTIIEKVLSFLSEQAIIESVADIETCGITKYSIKTNDPYALIGKDGQTLQAFNHLIKKIYEQQRLKEENKQEINFLIDVNDYQQKKIEELKMKAQIMAERARFFRSNIELSPMNPYERMIIHSFFTDSSDIETESTGIGKDRRVVIRFVEKKIV
jgi:spoIIIJ-associated protein